MIEVKKIAQAVVVAACVLMPWNATAVNQDKSFNNWFSKKLGNSKTESMAVQALLEISQGKNKQALNTVNELIRMTPNFKLAYMMKGDLLLAQTRKLEAIGGADESANEEVQGLRDEAKMRIEHYLDREKKPNFPNLLVQLDENQSHVILVDTVKSKLFLFKKTDGKLVYQSDYYITIGKNGFDKKIEGDKRTPLGVYFASKKLSNPLPDLYGDAAYPLDYPNPLDQKQNKSGSGIWLHGTPHDTYSRPPRASDGCVVLSNPDLKVLEPILQKGNTPVIIADHFDWADESQDAFATQKLVLNKEIETWRKDWVSQNTNQYLSHYSKNFFYSDGDFEKWAAHKRNVQSTKPKVAIQINDISILSHPSKPNIVVVNFEQDFKSPTLGNVMQKRQYWMNENNQWKIIYEGAS